MKNIKKLTLMGLLVVLLIVSIVILAAASMLEAEAQGSCCHVHYSHDEYRGGYSVDDIRRMLGVQPYIHARVHTEYEGVITYKIPAEEFSVENSEQSMQPFSNPYQVTTIRHSGMSNRDSIVVVLLADGFMIHEQGAFLSHAQGAIDTMLNTRPFSYFSSLFTVFAIQSISVESGVSRRDVTPHQIVNNRFGSFVPADGGIWSLNWTQVIRNLAGYVADGISNVNMIQVIVNTTLFGGVAFTSPHLTNSVLGVAFTTVMPGIWHNIFIHEFGHSFGSLADEHTESLRWEVANMTAEPINANVRWSHWIGHGGGGNANRNIGVFRAGHAPAGWAIPSRIDTCKMSQLFTTPRPFCSVCSAELTRRMAYLAGETFESRHPNPGQTNAPSQTHVTIPHGTYRILPYAFNGNRALNTLTIPSHISTIGRYAFLGATGLRRINNYSRKPQPVNATTFAGTGNHAVNRNLITVVVPPGTRQAYINAGWTGFNLIEGGLRIEDDVVTGFIAPPGFGGVINIPYGITAIDTHAFSNNRTIISVSIPSSVTSIGNSAFMDIISLSSITFLSNSNLQTIGTHTFRNTGLSQITIPASVTSIGNSAFSGANSLHSITFLPNSNLQTIGSHAFTNTSLTQITIPASVTTIGDSAFASLRTLRHINFEANSRLHTIGETAFWNSGLEHIVISASVTYIGSGAFNFIVPNNPNFRITWHYNPALTAAQLNISANLTEVIFPSSVTQINANAFTNALNLRNVQVPAVITYIGHHAFHVNARVTWENRYQFRGHEFLRYLGNATNFTVPSVIAGRAITTIGASAFVGAVNLQAITIAGTNPPAIDADNVFAGVDRSLIELVIENGNLQDFIEAGWVGFKGCPTLPPQPPPYDDYGWVWVFDIVLCCVTHWEYVGDSIKLSIQVGMETGVIEYVWVYLNAGESKWVSLCCCVNFYIEFDGSYFVITVYGSWIFVSYFVRVYRWGEPPLP